MGRLWPEEDRAHCLQGSRRTKASSRDANVWRLKLFNQSQKCSRMLTLTSSRSRIGASRDSATPRKTASLKVDKDRCSCQQLAIIASVCSKNGQRRSHQSHPVATSLRSSADTVDVDLSRLYSTRLDVCKSPKSYCAS